MELQHTTHRRAKKDFSNFEKETLVELLTMSHGTIEKKTDELRKTKEKLSLARRRMRKMNDIIRYQRGRMLEILI
jgi:hypothetical protein